jgi:acetyl-CoA hydrolase
MAVDFISPDNIDFRPVVRSGDMVVWGQGCAEPRGLTGALLDARARVEPFRCMVGIPSGFTSVRAEHADHVRFVSYTGSGVNGTLHDIGGLHILPVHYSRLPAVLSNGPRAADVVLLQVSPPDEDGRYSLGLANEYLSSAIDSARTVIVEINESVPRTSGRRLRADEVDLVTVGHLPPAEMPPAAAGERTQRIARNVAELIEDGSTLQIGLGAVPEAVLGALSDHHHLGIHSGLISDAVMHLMRSGAIDNSLKGIDRDVTVTGMIVGSTALFDFVADHPQICVRETQYTHDPQILASLHKFVSINSAIEVDLTGQCNAEVVSGRYIGAVGGAVDFSRGAQASPDGLAIVALPSTAGSSSRIVRNLSGPVSTSRADISVIVTEYGVADLRGRTLQERRELMIAIAHPDHIVGLSEAPR